MPGVNTGTALLILVVFVLPGFIAVLVKERIYEVRPEETTFDRLLVSVYYSLLIWSVPVVTALAGQADRGDLEGFFVGRSPVWVMVVAAVGVLLVLPVAAALLTWAWVRSSWRSATLDLLRLPAAHGTPTSWDFAFDAEDDLFVVVTMRDGRQLAGYYGSRSHSGYGTRARDLFLEERWELDQTGSRVIGRAGNTAGVWINADDIVAVDRYAVGDVQGS